MLDKILKPKAARGEVKLEVPLPDFIPYACHFDHNSILTKNGELLQTIKITGFAGQAVGAEDMELREEVRKAILTHIKSNNYALWFHTIRRKNDLIPKGKYPEGFSQNLHNEWVSKNNFSSTYVNELYITIIRDGQSIKSSEGSNFLDSFIGKRLKKNHLDFLDKINKELTQTVDSILQSLKSFGAQKLSIFVHNNIVYSQQLQFFSKLINLTQEPQAVPIEDLSDYLAKSKIAFGFNTMEVISPKGKRFGAVFTIKEYHELETKVLDQFLQLPQEFIITQTLDFINRHEALKGYKRQYEILEISEADDFKVESGLQNIMDSNTNSETDYGESQLSVIFLADKLDGLNKDVTRAVDALSRLGIVATRRDLRMEECYWSFLPANFSFITRKNPINTARIAGFASLYNFPSGTKEGLKWGAAVTIFHTKAGNPYFFNFHNTEGVGHTAILGPFGSGKTALVNFLMSESQKFGGRLFFFDQDRASKVFINALGGNYTIISPEEENIGHSFNPLLMEDNKKNRQFLAIWLTHLAQSNGKAISKEQFGQIVKIVEKIYSLPKEQRKLSNIAKDFGEIKPGSLGERMQDWYGKGKYAHLFDNDRTEIVSFDENLIYGFGMSKVISDKRTLAPVLSYLFHRIEMSLDGKPTIIVIDEAWNLINNPIFAPKLGQWLDMLSKKNAIVIFATETVPNSKENQLTNVVTEKIATKIFLPNIDAEKSNKAYKNVWGVSDQEYEMLIRMSTKKRQFMVKKQDDSIVTSLDLSGMKELQVLSGGDKTAKIMDNIILEKGENPNEWLPEFYKQAGS